MVGRYKIIDEDDNVEIVLYVYGGWERADIGKGDYKWDLEEGDTTIKIDQSVNGIFLYFGGDGDHPLVIYHNGNVHFGEKRGVLITP